jgi:hypothetical protein
MAALLLGGPARAEDEEFEHLWSTTLMGQFRFMTDDVANDYVGDFFDQYDFTPNKSSSVPFELAIRDAAWDVLGPGETPRMQFRFESPTSNLGVSGSQIDQPFLNQRADLFGRLDGLAFDLRYWRFRTEELRLFPNTLGRPFTDLTDPTSRFQHDRTGFFGEARVRPTRLRESAPERAEWLAPQLSLRGGYDSRDGERQFRFILPGSNTWAAIAQPLDQDVAKVGGGLLVAPGGLFTLTLDADYKQFRQNSPTVLASELGLASPANDTTIGFIPDTDRTVGSVRLQSRLGERAVLEGGFQGAVLEQVGDLTPGQIATGLTHNKLIYYSANFATDVSITDRVTANAFFKWDQRQNDIQRNTSLYNAADGSQVDEFLKRWNRIYAGAEAVYQLHRSNIVALGARFEWIERDLEFPAPTNPVLLRPNALMNDETQMWTIYGRTSLRPVKGLRLTAELGYRGAPKTGYIRDLDKYVYGKLRASYVIRLKRPVVVSAFVQGGTGENRDFTMVEGLGPMPSGQLVPRNFKRSDYNWGLTASTSPWRKLTLSASFFSASDMQDYGLVRSNLPRYFQNLIALDFFNQGSPDYENDQMSFILGSHMQFSDDTDGGLSYSFTRAKAVYEPGVPSPSLLAIASTSIVDQNIHGLQFEAGHRIRDGLRVLVGYRLQLLDDQAPVPSGEGSVVPPIPASMTQHTVMLGVTLSSDLLSKSD